MWLGSGSQAQEGIVLFDGRSLTNFKPANEGWIRTITEDKYGTIILATRQNSLIPYDGNTFSKYSSPKELGEDLLNNILVDSKGNVWYGSDYSNDRDPSTGGVWKFDGKSFTEFTKKDGLSNSSAYAFIEDKAGNIWIGTRDNGLYRYDGDKIVQYSK